MADQADGKAFRVRRLGGQPTGKDRVISGEVQLDDEALDRSLRPRRLADFVGQPQVKDNLNIGIRAAKLRQESLDHVIIYGPPGLGKTTLAHIIANEMGVNIKVTSGPAIERAGDMAAILTGLQPGDLLFIDEIHRLNRVVEEVMYSAMEDFFLSWMVGKGLAARNINLRINPFTLVGATTRFSLISAPMRDRFGSVFRLDYYDQADMEVVVRRSAEILDLQAEPDGILEIASRARGTPRIANRLLKRARDYALVEADNQVTGNVARAALDMLRVDRLGLDESDHRLLTNIIDKFSGGPVGLDTLSACLSEDSDTVMEVWEPYLLQLGFLERTSRGRVATPLAYNHLGRPWVDKTQSSADQPRFSGI
jgi:Holliday junction DNA helicase RuvB